MIKKKNISFYGVNGEGHNRKALQVQVTQMLYTQLHSSTLCACDHSCMSKIAAGMHNAT